MIRNQTYLTEPNVMGSALVGAARGALVPLAWYPFEVVKLHVQSSSESVPSIVHTLFQKEGARAFYKGFSHQVLRNVAAQAWCWPIIFEGPKVLSSHNVSNTASNFLTGLFLSTVSAVVTAPLERARIKAGLETRSVSLWSSYQAGWKGFGAFWMRQSVGWCTFLVLQEKLRERARGTSDHPLSLGQLLTISAQISLIVSVATAPFDRMNTVQHVRTQVSSSGRYFKGWSFIAANMLIQNMASVWMIEKFGK